VDSTGVDELLLPCSHGWVCYGVEPRRELISLLSFLGQGLDLEEMHPLDEDPEPSGVSIYQFIPVLLKSVVLLQNLGLFLSGGALVPTQNRGSDQFP